MGGAFLGAAESGSRGVQRDSTWVVLLSLAQHSMYDILYFYLDHEIQLVNQHEYSQSAAVKLSYLYARAAMVFQNHHHVPIRSC
jgi:hypothetical protein